MTHGEKFCLKWNDFENNISSAFQELRDDDDFCDVTLACDGNQLKAHKLILSACSPFFRSIFKKNKHQHPLIYLKGVKHGELSSVLNFMYHGEVNVAQEELNSFLAVAEEFQVKGLTQTEKSQSKISSDSRPNKPNQSRTSNYHQIPKQSESLEPSDNIALKSISKPEIEEVREVIKTEIAIVDVDHYPEPIIQQDDFAVDPEPGNFDFQDPFNNSNPAPGFKEQAAYNVYDDQGGIGESNQAFYSQHIRKASDGGYLCNLCDKQARDFYAMRTHLEGKHDITPGYHCPVCFMFCKTKATLMYHKKTYNCS